MLRGKVLDEDRPTVEEQSPPARWELSPEAKAHARQYKTWGNAKNDLSRRDSTKVAQYEVLGK
jgi:hypothetical protein